MLNTSIRFNVKKARALAAAKGFSLQGWADKANLSKPTIIAFLQGSARIKNNTVDEIMKPLGLKAADIAILRRSPAESPKETEDDAAVVAMGTR